MILSSFSTATQQTSETKNQNSSNCKCIKIALIIRLVCGVLAQAKKKKKKSNPSALNGEDTLASVKMRFESEHRENRAPSKSSSNSMAWLFVAWVHWKWMKFGSCACKRERAGDRIRCECVLYSCCCTASMYLLLHLFAYKTHAPHHVQV